MAGTKTRKILLNGYGSFLGMEKGCFTVKDRQGNIEKYPLFEAQIGEVVLKSGNSVSVGALASLGFWEIDTLVLTQKGKPVAALRSLEDYSYVKTRICQYEALKNKGVEIAKQIILGKIKAQNSVLLKYGLRQHDVITISRQIEQETNRSSLRSIEARFSRDYFRQIFQLFPKDTRSANRKTFQAYDGMNNLFNLTYTLLKWKIMTALLKAKLEPCLGFLHSEQYGKPSLVCDFMELYRPLIDDFLIGYCKNLKSKDFICKYERASVNRRAKREYLGDSETNKLIKSFYAFLESKVQIPRIKHGNRQTLETLINEEALLLAKFLRCETISSWVPRFPV